MRLRTRIVISVVIANSLISLFTGLYIINQIREFELSSLNERIEEAVHMIKLVNATPVYNVDRETVQMNMETFFQDKYMKRISFSEYDININLERSFNASRGEEIKKVFYITHKGLNLGRMEVVYSTSLIVEKTARVRNLILILSFFSIAFLSMILVLIIDRLMKPVNDLTKAASDIAAGNLEREIDQRAVGEVGELSRNFAVMRDAIQEKINDLALTNANLEKEISLKIINEKKIIKQNNVISSVNQFFQQTMLANTYSEVAEIFVSVILDTIPSRYCFISEIKKNRTNLLALSEKISQDSGVSEKEAGALSWEQEICGFREQILKYDRIIIENSPMPKKDFINFPESHLEISNFLGIPMKFGPEVGGIIMLAGKEGGYDEDDRIAAEILGTALVESFRLKRKEIEKKELEEMMIHSEKMVSIGGLAAGMAHEINNPLAGVLQNSQVILSRLRETMPPNMAAAKEVGLDFEKMQEYMAKRGIYQLMDLVLDAGKRAAEIVANMLSFSRKSSSGFMAEDICRLLDKTLVLAESDYNLKKKFDFRQIEIIKEYEPNLPRVNCKASEIQQVFFNLLSNGAQAMIESEACAVPSFRFTINQHGDDMVRIVIRDNGPGMDEEIRKRIFEPFFTTKVVGEGTGLGLSVSYFIITENHSGTIEAVSKLGTGTSFIIKLPVYRTKPE